MKIQKEIAAIALALYAITADATIFRYEFSGTISEGHNEIAAGQYFDVTIIASDQTRRTWWESIAGDGYDISYFSLNINGEKIETTSGNAEIDNNGSFAGDRVDLNSGAGKIGSINFYQARVLLADTSNLAINSYDLPSSLNIIDWQTRKLLIYGNENPDTSGTLINPYEIRGTIDSASVSTIPEPSSMLLTLIAASIIFYSNIFKKQPTSLIDKIRSKRKTLGLICNNLISECTNTDRQIGGSKCIF